MCPTTEHRPNILRAVKIEKPYHARALVDGWLCIKYLDNGEELVSPFADISRGDIILYGNATRSRPAPAADDNELEELGNQDIDPSVFKAYANACDRGAQEQFLREHDAATLLEGKVEAYQEIIPMLDARTKAYQEVCLKLAATRLSLRHEGGP